MVDATARDEGKDESPGDLRLQIEVEDVLGDLANVTVPLGRLHRLPPSGADLRWVEDRQRRLASDSRFGALTKQPAHDDSPAESRGQLRAQLTGGFLGTRSASIV